MRAETKTVYVSDDGKEFDTEEACLSYENELTFYSLLQTDGYYSDDGGGYGLYDYKQFSQFVTENYHWVLKNVLNIQPGDIR